MIETNSNERRDRCKFNKNGEIMGLASDQAILDERNETGAI